MPLPGGVEQVTVHSAQALTLPDGTWIQGTITFTAPDLVTIGGQDVVFGGSVKAQLVDGQFSVQLIATDATGMSPTGWTYKVVANFTNAPGWTRYISLPKAAPTVALADVIVPDPVTGSYATLIDPAALTGVVRTTGDQVIDGEKNFGERIPLGPGFDPEFDNQLARKAYVDAKVAAAGGGSGSSVRTATVRVTDDNLSGLPAAAAWTVAQTSAGTKLQCSIPAAAGDRIKVYGGFMRSGSHFLDWVLLDNTGAIAVYAGTFTSSPLPEGDPDLYPSLSFSYEEMTEMFTVASGHINAGSITVALAHQGTGSGIVYAHTTYPFRMRLENIGPEPA